MRLLHRLHAAADLVDRRSWTVRLPHGVHDVRLERTGFGDRLIVDRREVARTHAFAYDRTLRFRIDGARAELRSGADSERGVLTAELLVEDQRVEPDVVPPRRPRRIDVPLLLERAAYLVGAVLVVAGLAGDALTQAAATLVRTAGVVVLTLGLRAIDPLGLFPAVIEKIAAGQVPMIVGGIEIAAFAAIARDRGGVQRYLSPLRSRRWTTRLLGWAAVASIALALLAIA